MLYSSEISPTRCNNFVFILRNGFYCGSKAIADENAIVASCWTYFTTMRFQLFMAVVINNSVFKDMTPYGLVHIYIYTQTFSGDPAAFAFRIDEPEFPLKSCQISDRVHSMSRNVVFYVLSIPYPCNNRIFSSMW